MFGQALTKLDDSDLMHRIARGDSRAFAVIVDRYAGAVRHWAWLITQDDSDADDVCQEVYIQLWRNASAFKAERGRLATWLRTITRNLAIKQRQRQLAHTHSDTELDDHPDPKANLEATLHQKQQQDWLLQSVTELPPGQRHALQLVYGQGLSNRQAAERMQLGLKALEALLVRAKRKLRQAASSHTSP